MSNSKRYIRQTRVLTACTVRLSRLHSLDMAGSSEAMVEASFELRRMCAIRSVWVRLDEGYHRHVCAIVQDLPCGSDLPRPRERQRDSGALTG